MIRLFTNSAAYNWGATPEEISARYGCDNYVENPDDVLYRAVNVHASKPIVYKWLCQLRVAPYSYDWIDNHGRQSPRDIMPGLDDLAIGIRFMEMLELVQFAANEHITLIGIDEKFKKTYGEIAVSYIVKSISSGETRLIAKLAIRRTNHPVFKLLAPLLPLGDLIMMRKQMLTLKRLSERK